MSLRLATGKLLCSFVVSHSLKFCVAVVTSEVAVTSVSLYWMTSSTCPILDIFCSMCWNFSAGLLEFHKGSHPWVTVSISSLAGAPGPQLRGATASSQATSGCRAGTEICTPVTWHWGTLLGTSVCGGDRTQAKWSDSQVLGVWSCVHNVLNDLGSNPASVNSSLCNPVQVIYLKASNLHLCKKWSWSRQFQSWTESKENEEQKGTGYSWYSWKPDLVSFLSF